jgi:hypothetical protein
MSGHVDQRTVTKQQSFSLSKRKMPRLVGPIGSIFPWLYIPEFLPQQTSEP